MRAGGAERELDVTAVLPVAQASVVERVEHELAREPKEVERPRPVVGQERAGGGEVLAVHDFGRLVGGVLVRPVAVREPFERGVEIAKLLIRVAGLAQFVAARVAERLDAVSQGGVRVGDQPARRLHDVGVGIVHDSTRRVVRHPPSLARHHEISSGRRGKGWGHAECR